MRLAITGGTGIVGRFLVEEALAAGDDVTVLGRTAPERPAGFRHWDLVDPPPDLAGFDALLHAGFAHVPGRYRGGEGDDPEGFLRRNRDGSIALFHAAARAGVAQAVFLSSRAVYGAYPPGTRLTEALEPRPDTLYGEVKLAAESALSALSDSGFTPVSLRVTGIYGPAGPGRTHKWSALFARFRKGEPVEPRAGTEVHGADLAAAVRLLLARRQAGVFNVSDILLDRRDLLSMVTDLTGADLPLPERSPETVNEMDCTRLRGLGWRPGGVALLRASLPALLDT